MKLKKNLKLYVVTVLLTWSLGLAYFGPAGAQPGPNAPGKWLAGDFHQHTTLTDGSHSIEEGFAQANRFGLDWWANSEHGGAFSRNAYNQYFDTLTPPVTFLGDNAGLDGAHQKMWRWQSLLQYSFPVLDRLRQRYPDQAIIQGLEWNVPGHEHCSVGLVADSAKPLAQFEYLFDAENKDITGGKAAPFNFEDPDHNGVAKNPVNNHAKALQAVSWLKRHYGRKSWTIFAHPERKSLYKINDFRDFNNAAPEVAFGFESLPGHQKAANRGEYGDTDPAKNIADGRQTYGGAGIYSARVGGLWDALLAEGRHWWLFVNSDFHNTKNDFWQGEYCKTWTFVVDRNRDGRYSAQEIADALRSGNTFCVLGDLINALEFSVKARDETATMGETLKAQAGEKVKFTIKFKSPRSNNNGNQPRVDHIDLIAGSVTGKIPPTLPEGTAPNPAYAQIKADAKVIARFTDPDWELGEDGWKVIHYQVKADKDRYFRLRGTNQSLRDGQLDRTNDNLDPQADPLGANTPAAAWADLWFYSNPIFVKVVGKTE
ncbi:MAG: hypothetical protein AB1491_01420 [Thermodesulfobacteriota bacterium]